MSPARVESGAPTALLERAMEILGCFDEKHSALTLTQLAQLTKLPMSTCHRIVGTLEDGGFLSKGSDRKFRVGTKLWTIAQHAPLSERLRESALPTLARLYEETGENVTLAVLDRGQALYVDRLVGERSIPTISRAGGHLPLHTTGVGKVLLAYQSEKAIEQYLSKPLPRPTPQSITQPDALRKDLAEVRKNGYSITRQEMTRGSGSIAVPIMRNGRCVAAVGVIVHLNRLDVNRLVSTLTDAAASISAELDGH
ncbi:DNA-binding IclR family transcriptional regulator [Aurantimicrobium minutum]|jgi:DNA-binding IclR family transcriptional regulator|uniref:IclR family transcriptional regulator n=1 Tax=Aurantimicrobium minutum TaxID=708131 RepID=UPI0024073FD5|nr:IclR family transcriptional regulator [Aurantimicrobium minutum]MDF9810548.1 DNA-binding IclR family transcriptional regulator [Aurantimicrobium minutum]